MKKKLREMTRDNLCRLKLLDKLTVVEKYFTKRKYIDIVELARELFERGQFDLCEKQLEKLPSNGELLEQLIRKLRKKSVYKTLRQLQEGKVGNDLLTAKGLSSLLTHIIIECDKGNDECKVLIPNVIEKLNEIIYNIL